MNKYAIPCSFLEISYRAVIISLFVFTSCQFKRESSLADWYLQVKAELDKLENIKEGEALKYIDKSGRLILDYYRNGIVYHSEGYIRDTLRFETYFSNNHDYELRREFCNQHAKTFEGIFYKMHMVFQRGGIVTVKFVCRAGGCLKAISENGLSGMKMP